MFSRTFHVIDVIVSFDSSREAGAWLRDMDGGRAGKRGSRQTPGKASGKAGESDWTLTELEHVSGFGRSIDGPTAIREVKEEQAHHH